MSLIVLMPEKLLKCMCTLYFVPGIAVRTPACSTAKVCRYGCTMYIVHVYRRLYKYQQNVRKI